MKTIGEYYKDTILSLPKSSIRKIELPSNGNAIRIEDGLFGWKIISGEEYIECKTEEEARYLKVFIECQMQNIYIPKNIDYLKKILPELETIKKRIDEIIEESTIAVHPKIKERLIREVLEEITKEGRE